MQQTLAIEGSDVTFRVVLDGPEHAPPLMFSNSLGTSLEMWDAQVPAFARSHRIIRYDVRGHGLSGTAGGPVSMARLAQDALLILNALHIHKTDWIGCSMGGMVGQWLLIHHRERLGKAVLGNTAASMGPPGTDWNARIRMAFNQGMAPIAEQMKLRWFTRRFNETNPAEVAQMTDQLRRVNPAGYAACCAAIRDFDLREAIKSITNPVLVVIGAEDVATPPAMGELIARSIPGAKTLVLLAGHASNCEVAQAYNDGVVAFLNEGS